MFRNIVFFLALFIAFTAYSEGGDGKIESFSVKRIPFGMDGLPNQDEPGSIAEAEQLGLRFARELFGWIEDKPGEYRWPDSPENDKLKQYFVELKKRGYVIEMVDGTVHMDQKHMPKVVSGKRFNDPDVLERWEAYLTAFLERYGDEIDYFAIGNEVVSYFGGHKEEWPDYVEFFKRGAETIHRLRPGLKVGIVLAEEKPGRYWSDVEPYCDFFGYNYYTPNSMFKKSPTANALDPSHENYFEKTFAAVLAAAGAKPIVIGEIGCATHPEIDSSPELQSQFIQQLFQWLRGKEERILGIAWLGLQDWPYEGTKMSLQGYLDSRLLEHKPFMRYLTSLGLKYEDGVPKPGYGVFVEELKRYNSGT